MTCQYARYPAAVTTSDGTVVNRAAVVVIDHQALLATERSKRDHTDGGGVQVIATLDDVTVETQHHRLVVLRAEDGQTWTVGVGDGCGCANPLRSWYQSQTRGQPLST